MGLKTFINVMLGKFSDYTGSFTPKNKFSDVKEYVKSKKFLGHSMAGRALRDVENGSIWDYEYDAGGGNSRTDCMHVVVRVSHFGEFIRNMTIELHSNNPKEEMEKAVKKMEQALPVYEGEEKAPKEEKETYVEVEVVDYSGKSFSELLTEMDNTLKDFAKTPNMAKLTAIKQIRSAMDDKLELAEKGKYSDAFGKIDLYITTLNSQLSNPVMAKNAGQFVEGYVSQMRTALSEIAAKL